MSNTSTKSYNNFDALLAKAIHSGGCIKLLYGWHASYTTRISVLCSAERSDMQADHKSRRMTVERGLARVQCVHRSNRWVYMWKWRFCRKSLSNKMCIYSNISGAWD